MEAARYVRAKKLFERALRLPGEQRASFLESSCAGDMLLQREVQDLLRHHEAAGGFLTGRAGIAEPPGEPVLLAHTLRGYTIERVLGRGGMGVVYLARQETPRREVAIKFLRLDALASDDRERFRREAEILGRLNHPGIAHVHEAGVAETEDGARPWIAMEYVRGTPLVEHVASRVPDLRELLGLVAEICDAIDHAHQRGIVHRDIKPSNVLVDELGHVRVLDFGVARLLDDGAGAPGLRTRTGQLVGTLAYASPEQVTGERRAVDARSDVYSLGVLLFELVTGMLPYAIDEGHVLAAIQTISEQEPRRLRRLRPSAPTDLETVVQKALAKEPARRYADAGELAADLRRLLADRPVAARAPTAIYQVQKFVRRNRVVSASALVVLLALLVAVGALSVSQRRIRSQLDATNANLAAIAREMFGLVPALGFGEDHRRTLEVLEQLLAAQLELDPTDSLLDARARALSALGTLDQARGDHVRALERMERARSIREELAARRPSDLESRTHLSLIYAKLGELAAANMDQDGRERWFERALALDEQLVRENPGDGELLEDLGWSLERMYALALERGDLARADELARRRMDDALLLVEREPGHWKYVYNAAQAHLIAANLAQAMNDPERASRMRRAVLPYAQQLCELEPRRADFLFLRANACYIVGDEHLKSGREMEGIAHMEQAFELLTRLLANDPGRTGYARLLWSAANGMLSTQLGNDRVRSQMILVRLRSSARLAGEESRNFRFLSALADATEAGEERRWGAMPEAERLRERAYQGLLETLTEFTFAPEELEHVALFLGTQMRERSPEFCRSVARVDPELARWLAQTIQRQAPGPGVELGSDGLLVER